MEGTKNHCEVVVLPKKVTVNTEEGYVLNFLSAALLPTPTRDSEAKIYIVLENNQKRLLAFLSEKLGIYQEKIHCEVSEEKVIFEMRGKGTVHLFGVTDVTIDECCSCDDMCDMEEEDPEDSDFVEKGEVDEGMECEDDDE
ncbi:hypothetical protein EIN_162230 [Entamoeba invadens IP1]|uniref:Nucleoplasmin-like domain-containing protein n=1 Tax=Entamoeba invadens IP1 TaxID=370355 RepID=A0A0A1TYM5_ENTIV|nr:hypothetical protein EIN_162230 [Entamoeba invadens IP1]ELP86589.1 hypothetical protein EIN_162230 [Entamoeba invadens IP1]|eukprot:XP_004185935.1 hypothetical protein EIN_162230 [Entamoeba invadens IP1]